MKDVSYEPLQVAAHGRRATGNRVPRRVVHRSVLGWGRHRPQPSGRRVGRSLDRAEDTALTQQGTKQW